jgi:acyl-CoA dehydrogenase
MELFNQAPPELTNQYDDDSALLAYLRRTLPPDVFGAIEPELIEMGALAGGELYRMQLADRLNEPVLTHWDPWGRRVDHIEVTPVWKHAEKIAAERGVVATAYERKHGRYSRIHQFALVHLFSPSTDVYSCPLAMTDGAARTILESKNRELIDRAVPRLTTRDPSRFWTSGQWMTESTGGSDVGRSETIAKEDSDGTWRLYGRKWFTSATTSQMALTLARPEGNPPGGHGLAMFFVETRNPDGTLRNIELNRLKDKLGTRKVPTAELMLRGTPAIPVTELENGIRNITPMLNVTRTWNAVSSACGMRRAIALARDYARRRVAFGGRLSDKPLHLDTLAGMQAEYEGALLLSFLAVELLGKIEAREADEHDHALFRIVTPLAKLTTGKQAVAVASEALECFGGAGYVEDTGLPVLLRDAQVLPIWEGTTNVLALDVLRALSRDRTPFEALFKKAFDSVANVGDPQLGALGKRALATIQRAGAWLISTMARDPLDVEAGARHFALTLGRSLMLALLVGRASHGMNVAKDRRGRAAALRFARERFDFVGDAARNEARYETVALALDEPVNR